MIRLPLVVLLALAASAVCHAEEVGCKHTVSVPKAGNLSAAVYRADGVLVRTLEYWREVQPGKVELAWDGLDDYGRPLPAGDYTIKTVLSNARAEFVMAVGNGRNPSRPDDMGLVLAGKAVATDRQGRLIAAGQVGGESPMTLQLFSSDGKLLKGLEPTADAGAVASDGKFAYLAAYKTIEGKPLAFIMRMDLEAEVPTASQVDYPGLGGVAAFEDRVAEAVPGKCAPDVGGPVYWEPDARGDERASPYGPSADWWRVHSICLHEGKLYIAVPSTERIVVMDATSGQVERQIPVENVAAVAVGPDGRLYVCAGAKVLTMARDGGQRATFAGGFDAPYALAVDAQGNVVVSDHGGRPLPYSSTMPKLVKLAPGGNVLWRIGADGREGSLDGKVEPRRLWHPTTVATDADGNIYISEPTLPRIQKFTRDGAPLFSLTALYAEEMCVDPENPEELYATYGGAALRRYILDYENRTWRLDAAWRRIMCPWKFMTTDMRVAHVQGERFLAIWDGGLFRVGNSKSQTAFPEPAADSYLLRHVKQRALPGAVFEDGRLIKVEMNPDTREISVWETPCSGYDIFACPIYREQDRKLLLKTDPAFNKAHDLVTARSYHIEVGELDGDGNLYVLGMKTGRGKGIPYWSRMFEKACVEKYDRNGKFRWAVGRKTSSFVSPGEFYGPNKVRYHDGLVVHSDVSGVVSIFDRDGLMVGFLVKDSARGHTFFADPLGGCGESWCHHIFTHPKTGKLYYIHQDHGSGSFRVLEFIGLKDLVYGGGPVSLKQAAPAKEETAQEQEDYVAQVFKAGKISVDGTLNEWTDQAPIRLWAEKGRQDLPNATLNLRYDVRFLYIGLHVRGDTTPAVNKNAASRDLVWKGDCMELYVGTDIASWHKGKYAATDYQLMLAPGPDSTGKAYCWTRHAWVEGSKVAWKVDADAKGYALEAQVPWSFFQGPPPESGKRIPFDVRVMCGDEGGRDFAYNLIWSARNMAFNDTSEWGQAVLEHFAVSSEAR